MKTSESGDYTKTPRQFGPGLKPYTAIALQVGSPAIMRREEYRTVTIPHIKRCINMAMPGAALINGYPVRLVCLTEAGLNGWRSVYKLSVAEYCRDMAVEIPGEETEMLGEICNKHNIYMVAVLRTLEPDIIKDRHFNVSFVIDPQGKIILKTFKLNMYKGERSTTPHDVWDRFVAKYGDGLDAFFPVVDTEIGRLGCTVCADGLTPETYRAYAMQGVEVLSHPDYLAPAVSRYGVDTWGLINRARAFDTCAYLVCPSGGPEYHRGLGPEEPPINQSGGRSMIVDYRGVILNEFDSCVEGFAAGPIDIQRLREYRLSEMTMGVNLLSMFRTEYYRKLCEEPIYPKNLWIDKESTYSVMNETIKQCGQKLVERGIWLPPE